MLKTLAPTTGIIMTAANSGMTHIDAVSEFVDNSFGEAAGNASSILVVDAKDGTAFIDQGRGVSDINLLFRLGDGESRNHSGDIGKFGVGSKFGALTFGMKVTVHTVYKNVYHHHTIDWGNVLNSNVWPNAYSGKGHPAVKAPKVIRNGGTIILVEHLHANKPRPKSETYTKRLGLRFMPSIDAGKDIILRRAKSLKDVLAGRHDEELSISAEMAKIVKRSLRKIEHHKLEVNGKKFDAMFAELPDGDKNMSGIHITFSGRVIETINSKLNDMKLPSKFFGRIDLSSAFKDDLNYNKTIIVNGRDELFEAILKAAEALIDKLAKAENEKVFEKLAADISNMMSPDFGAMLRKNKEGKYTRKENPNGNMKVPNDVDPNAVTDIPVDDPSTPRTEENKTDVDVGDSHNKGGAFEFKLLREEGGEKATACKAEMTDEGNKITCTVTLNVSVSLIKSVMDHNPNNKPSVLLLCLTAMASSIALDDNWVRALLGSGADDVISRTKDERQSAVFDSLIKVVISK